MAMRGRGVLSTMELLPFSNFLNYKYSLGLSQALQQPAVREGLLETAPWKAGALSPHSTLSTHG